MYVSGFSKLLGFSREKEDEIPHAIMEGGVFERALRLLLMISLHRKPSVKDPWKSKSP